MADSRLIICNTSPLINLAEIDHLDLLEWLLGPVCIPPAVRDELLAKSDLFPKAALAANSGRFRVLSPSDNLLVRSFSANLHRGEAECLALGMERPDSLLILDDLSARAYAGTHQLSFTGTLGILSAAKARGRISSLSPVLRDLRLRARFWISSDLERLILTEAGEMES
jgi:predicted nucleic acid-binding protein